MSEIDFVLIIRDALRSFKSLVELIDLDLDFLKLLKELLQTYFSESNSFGAVDILTAQLLEVALLYVFIVSSGLFIGLQIERKLHSWCSHISDQHRLFTRSCMVKDSVVRFGHISPVKRHIEHPVEILEDSI